MNEGNPPLAHYPVLTALTQPHNNGWVGEGIQINWDRVGQETGEIGERCLRSLVLTSCPTQVLQNVLHPGVELNPFLTCLRDRFNYIRNSEPGVGWKLDGRVEEPATSGDPVREAFELHAYTSLSLLHGDNDVNDPNVEASEPFPDKSLVQAGYGPTSVSWVLKEGVALLTLSQTPARVALAEFFLDNPRWVRTIGVKQASRLCSGILLKSVPGSLDHKLICRLMALVRLGQLNGPISYHFREALPDSHLSLWATVQANFPIKTLDSTSMDEAMQQTLVATSVVLDCSGPVQPMATARLQVNNDLVILCRDRVILIPCIGEELLPDPRHFSIESLRLKVAAWRRWGDSDRFLAIGSSFTVVIDIQNRRIRSRNLNPCRWSAALSNGGMALVSPGAGGRVIVSEYDVEVELVRDTPVGWPENVSPVDGIHVTWGGQDVTIFTHRERWHEASGEIQSSSVVGGTVDADLRLGAPVLWRVLHTELKEAGIWGGISAWEGYYHCWTGLWLLSHSQLCVWSKKAREVRQSRLDGQWDAELRGSHEYRPSNPLELALRLDFPNQLSAADLETVFPIALERGAVEIVRAVLSGMSESDQAAIWFQAVKLGREEVINVMAPNHLNRVDGDSRSALHHAAALGDIKLVRRLIQAEAETSGMDRVGFTPLGLACLSGHELVAKFLILTGGADPLLGRKGGVSAVTLFVIGSVDTIVPDWLAGRVAQSAAHAEQARPFAAAFQGVPSWISDETGVEQTLADGSTLLMWSCAGGSDDVEAMLRHRGADTDAMDDVNHMLADDYKRLKSLFKTNYE